ncbi:MAG: hypothetical protein JNJ40_12555 [Bacteroidia bacterium]|nr:hypothetical protein [Bacteroidia bacterium]
MIELVKHCIKEIIIVSELLKIKNSSFYKRSLARFISVRIDDFIKLGFKLNKDSINLQIIKDDLNALQKFYEEFLKLQRDKYGAHVQDLDFSQRIEVWLNIDLQKTTFFTEQPISIYKLFDSLPGYEPPEQLFSGISNELERLIIDVNHSLDLESAPRMAMDIFSLTRYNSSGVLFCHPMQDKAGVLKGLELLITYEYELLKVIDVNLSLSNVIKKMLILDVISYCDNLFTRTDIQPGALQEMDGLDKFIVEEEHPAAYELLMSFKASYLLVDNAATLRTVRNKVCGHITPQSQVQDLEVTLESVTNKWISEFYSQLKNVFTQICGRELTFKMFLIEPNKMQGVGGFTYKPSKAFSDDTVPVTEFIHPDINSNDEIEKHYKQLINMENPDEVRHFFWDGFCSSSILENRNISITTTEGQILHHNYTWRKHFEFFERRLNSDIPLKEKIEIIQLFTNCSGGYPETLSYVLQKTYKKNCSKDQLNLEYIGAFGELARKRDRELFEFISSNHNGKDFYSSFFTVLSLFKIDMVSRRIGYSNDVDFADNEFSLYIDKCVESVNGFFRTAYIFGMASESYFGHKCLTQELREHFHAKFIREFRLVFKKYVASLIKSEEDEKNVENIIKYFDLARYSTSIGLIFEFFTKKGRKDIAHNFLILVVENLVKVAPDDDTELKNLSFIFKEAGFLANAVQVSEYLVNKLPSDIDLKTTLLDLYKINKQRDKFDQLKRSLLNNFVITENERLEITDFIYD